MPTLTTISPTQSFKLNDPHLRANPYPTYARLRKTQPLVRSTLPFVGPVWVVTRYDDVIKVLKDPRFSTAFRAGTQRNPFAASWMPRLIRVMQTSMLRVDDPDHARLRKLVHLAFTPKRVAAFATQVEHTTYTLLETVNQKQYIDVIADFALPLPLTVISEMMGVPPQERIHFRNMLTKLEAGTSGKVIDLLLSLPAASQIVTFIKDLIHLRRTDPHDDLITALVTAEQAGDRLSEDELIAMIMELLVAGHETTVNLIGSGTLALLEHPDQLRLLHQNPSLIECAVEELLRFTNPVEYGTLRYVRESVEVQGITLPVGSIVVALLSAANRDEAVFENPEQLDISRHPNRHLAFGVGGHYCLGAPLARLEGQIALRALTQRYPKMQLAVGAEKLHWNNTFIGLRGLKALPVRLA